MIEWKDVNKELPEEDGWYLVWLKNDDHCYTPVGDLIKEKGESKHLYFKGDYGFMIDPITDEMKKSYCKWYLNKTNQFKILNNIYPTGEDVKVFLNLTHFAYINKPK
jgi:hypothetical protein